MPRNLLVLFILLSLCLFAPALRAQDVLLAPVLQSGALHCTALEPLATWLGAAVAWNDDRTQVKVTLGPRSLTIQPGSLLAQNEKGTLVLLPALPVILMDTLFVPTEAVVKALGGVCQALEDGRIALTLHGKNIILAAAPVLEMAKEPLGRIAQALRDPRVPLAGAQADLSKVTQVKKYIDGFLRVVRTIQPTLEGVAESKTLKMMSNVPMVGALIKNAQDTAGLISDAITLAQRIATVDQQYLEPIRAGLQAANALSGDVGAAGAAAAKPQFVAANGAIEKQLALNAQASKHLKSLLSAMLLVDGKVDEFKKTYPDVEMPLSVDPAIKSTRELQLVLDAHRTRMTSMKDLFTRLIAESDALAATE